MENPIEQYWQIRLDELRVQLEKNNFEVFTAENSAEAGALVMNKILPETGAKSVSYGGSMTMKSAGLHDALLACEGIELLRPDEPGLSFEEKIERRRQGLLVDFYITGTNAVTEAGHLVNLDMIGNRVGALTFGPKNVVVLIGRNKIVPDLDSAMYRIKEYASPVNAMRLDCKTPCVKTSHCEDCKSPGRICNTWTITEKSFPKARVKVVLINEELGF
ncbi:lactate utilization protein [Desulfosediminicola ganghwensis]|uniref:lactate utilization protein n=1 Tax=Desulfosediminicola ganghwensis TaxID=2569540 RepID=UPI0010AC5394|nr:lactate utilization protein [Desulfosediminicola ganghwensis]